MGVLWLDTPWSVYEWEYGEVPPPGCLLVSVLVCCPSAGQVVGSVSVCSNYVTLQVFDPKPEAHDTGRDMKHGEGWSSELQEGDYAPSFVMIRPLLETARLAKA